MDDPTRPRIDANHTAKVVPERYLMEAPPFTPTPDPCTYLRAEIVRLEAELTRLRTSQPDPRIAREAVLDEAAKLIEANIELCSAGGNRLRKRPDGDVSNLIFAKAIRALKDHAGSGA